MADQEAINTEKIEIRTLIDKGVAIEVERRVSKRKSGFWGFLGRRITVTEKQKFIINEPTLAVLDCITAEQLELGLDVDELLADMDIEKAKHIAKHQNRRMAKILALTVLGEDYFICSKVGKSYRYTTDDKRLEELTEFFNQHIKPSKLFQYCVLINNMSNLGDFINSIRLMSAARTTQPNRIEENTQA